MGKGESPIESFVSRRFLNAPTEKEPSVIVCSVTDACEFNLHISDCSRTVCLHEYLDSAGAYNRALHKLEQIKEVTEEMLNHLNHYKKHFK